MTAFMSLTSIFNCLAINRAGNNNLAAAKTTTWFFSFFIYIWIYIFIIFLVVWSVQNNNLAKTTTWLLPSLLFDQKTAGIDKIDFLTKFPGKKAAILFLLCCFRSLLRKSVALRVESTAAYFQGKSCGFSKCLDAKKPTRYQAAYKFVWNVE